MGQKIPLDVAIVTGASSGIGEALSLKLAERGVRVGLLARRGTVLEALADRIREAGGEAFAAPCDVTRRQDVVAAVEEIRLRLGPIDLVVANAGIGNADSRGEYDAESDERVYRVNVIGALNVIYACLPAMIAAGGGRVCGISSLASYQGLPGKGKYCGSKAALRVHLEALRAELRPKGILVTTICPGFIRTPMTDVHDFDMPFLMETDDAAGKILRAIQRGQREVRFPLGLSLGVRLGRVVPRALYDRIVRREPKGGRTQPRSTD